MMELFPLHTNFKNNILSILSKILCHMHTNINFKAKTERNTSSNITFRKIDKSIQVVVQSNIASCGVLIGSVIGTFCHTYNIDNYKIHGVG